VSLFVQVPLSVTENRLCKDGIREEVKGKTDVVNAVGIPDCLSEIID
jgi:hypothetical protein